MREQGRDVVEQDARLGEIRDRPDMLLQIHRHSFARHAPRGRYSNRTDAARKRGFRGSRQDRPQTCRLRPPCKVAAAGWRSRAGMMRSWCRRAAQWLVASAAELDRDLNRLDTIAAATSVRIDLARIEMLDTVGAWLVLRTCRRFAGARHRRQHRERAAGLRAAARSGGQGRAARALAGAAARPRPGDPGDAGVCRRGDVQLPRRIARAARLFRPGLHRGAAGVSTSRRGSEPSRWWRRCSASACRRCPSSGCCRF